ncbi:MAG: glycosyltransferase [Lachnospiraceae bacterium]|nr:glycosyltransferase [Lachnospiraceae bacterium]
MKWLFFGQRVSVHEDILWGAVELGWDIDRSKYRVPDSEYSDEDLENVKKEAGTADIFLTVDFSAAMAEAAHLLGRIYVCWVYDCPQRALYRKEALYDENIIFLFDRKELAKLKTLGLKHLHYLPLAANMQRAAGLNISDEDIRKYRSDISFVGNLYHNAERSAAFVSLSSRFPGAGAELDSYFNKYFCNWDHSLKTEVTDETSFIDPLYRVIKKENTGQYPSATKAFWVRSLLDRELSCRERREILSYLSSFFAVDLYTRDTGTAADIPMLRVHPPVEYETEMYRVFFASSLNLNITMRSIESGVPQRVFDIMSVGGCVLTNRQDEIDELFIPGKEILCFSSREELKELAAYYLIHEQERVRIGISGYQRVKNQYNYTTAAEKILRTVITDVG